MQHLLAPPRTLMYPGIRIRLVRGGSGSAAAHAVLVILLAVVGGSGVPILSVPSGPRVVSLPSLGVTLDSAPRREPEAPFDDKPDDTPPESIPLTVHNYVSGEDFTIDLARIRQRRNDLFPFVTWDLRLLEQRPATSESGIEWPQTFAGGPSFAKPLALSPGALQALIDRAWSRRERWSNLAEMVKLADQYDPDTGDLPKAFNGYTTQNVPQPYEDSALPDPVFWITLTLAGDDAPLLAFTLDYLRRHPASRVTTELLFLLDQSAETSCDVLGDVLMVGTDKLLLEGTRRGNPEAYELAVSLASAYRAWIWKYGVNAAERCAAARSTILRRIVETSPGGYGASDARFRLGEMLWTSGHREDAVKWWRGMIGDDRSAHARGTRDLLGAINDGAALENPARITRLLHEEELRWRERAGERLDYFGGTANRF
jgi:hypothetical protein